MAKGGGFERQICKELSLWWTHEGRDDVFWRATQSGGRATTRAKRGVRTANSSGDICYLDAAGKPFIDGMIVEIKRGYGGTKKRQQGLRILEIVDSNKKNFVLLGWLEKLERERVRAGRKYGWLIFRRDRMVSCITMEFTLFHNLMAYCGPFEGNSIMIAVKKQFIIVRLDEFLKWCSPKVLEFHIAEYTLGKGKLTIVKPDGTEEAVSFSRGIEVIKDIAKKNIKKGRKIKRRKK